MQVGMQCGEKGLYPVLEVNNLDNYCMEKYTAEGKIFGVLRALYARKTPNYENTSAVCFSIVDVRR
jgi:hypothetical protein